MHLVNYCPIGIWWSVVPTRSSVHHKTEFDDGHVFSRRVASSDLLPGGRSVASSGRPTRAVIQSNQQPGKYVNYDQGINFHTLRKDVSPSNPSETKLTFFYLPSLFSYGFEKVMRLSDSCGRRDFIKNLDTAVPNAETMLCNCGQNFIRGNIKSSSEPHVFSSAV